MSVVDAPRSYFNSVPGTPRGGASQSGCSTPRSGAEIYAAFMDNYHRRLRKPQPCYGDDAAGLTNNHRVLARTIPHKGKGTPPPDNFEPSFRSSKKFITGRSFAASPEILAHHEKPNILSMSMDSGMMSLAMQQQGSRPGSAQGGRLCLRICDQSFKSSMQGSGLAVIAEAPVKRPIRKAGTAAPNNDTKARVLVFAEDLSQSTKAFPTTPTSPAPYSPTEHDSFNSPRDAMLNSTWARHAYEAGVGSAPVSRPSTAPASSGACPDHRNEARRRYQDAHSNSNLDVYRHRHTGGICPAEYKFDDSRMPSPQLSSPKADSAREAYYAARIGFAQNRVKSLISLKQYA